MFMDKLNNQENYGEKTQKIKKTRRNWENLINWESRIKPEASQLNQDWQLVHF